MAEIHFSESAAQALKGRVVVLTGGAQGIGGATVALFHKHGAHVYFGDWDDIKGQQLEQTLRATETGGSVHFQKLDVRDYSSQLALFDTPFAAHGHVDVAVSCAAISEPPGLFEPQHLNLKTVRQASTTSSRTKAAMPCQPSNADFHQDPLAIQNHVDINLTSVIAFSRLALAYMKESKHEPAPTGNGFFSKSICLVSSIAGLTEAPGLFAYAPAKHGVVGLMRALRPWAPATYGVRANAICPWATDTQLLAPALRDRWAAAKLPLNAPHDVARAIVQCSADAGVHGTAVFVAGGRFFDTEAGLARTLPLWMGEENAEEFLRGQDVLGLGDKWTE